MDKFALEWNEFVDAIPQILENLGDGFMYCGMLICVILLGVVLWRAWSD